MNGVQRCGRERSESGNNRVELPVDKLSEEGRKWKLRADEGNGEMSERMTNEGSEKVQRKVERT